HDLRNRAVLRDGAREVGRADAAGDRGPVFTVVVGAEHVRLEVVLLITVGGDVGGGGAGRRRLHHADVRQIAERLRRDVLPVGAAVAGHLHVAVVGARP